MNGSGNAGGGFADTATLADFRLKMGCGGTVEFDAVDECLAWETHSLGLFGRAGAVEGGDGWEGGGGGFPPHRGGLGRAPTERAGLNLLTFTFPFLALALLTPRYAANTTKSSGQPFFLGVGLRKPHLDWRVPQGYLDLYPPVDQIPTANHTVAQHGRPDVAVHGPWRYS